ncbi:MAG: DSBA oxidoreductase [Candidatus Daviesbacteria bacterium GW2011_GWA1_41_61]|uniref:DSBA oxidoreductase n=1 Tax=Candidatus Daviesbacteria bacterium GW2011_GWA2_40_9 TaxID=1618424 RepID=A0A0G0U3Q2_9BACT|nr:MAG: DSBA-like protein thioredoxin domain protein [Candidatus Daviesbacteria bacterium GW2011_GWC1_40_9]KKR83728.1 MAG: DSBA oxidoreductase [Candidatus Daviesbacteria bacterium GW2011_GWA2_40_9]KKR93677.1 MAG: DSBA oxidoreductase [Candidatus Daviesbacteria bacterium GW2011_GWB1_41_15]KKS15143.1 MAG: DSBA oxidoreductase [Candidatus Daviesbacteria bacterium GW2011_GWA1_41_61]
MEDKNTFLTTPIAVLLGSVIIALAILVSGGVITLKKEAKVPAAKAADNNPQTQKGTADFAVANIKAQVKNLGLDQKKFDSCLDSGQKASLVSADQEDGVKLGVNGTPAVLINGHLVEGAQPYTVFKDAIEYELKGGNWETADSSVAYLVDGNPQNGEIGKEKKEVKAGDNPVLGNTQASVTLVEFSDYQCPFCERLYKATVVQLKKDYIDTGKVKLYYRDFPLTQIHFGALKAAEAARCAGDQGKYWEFHNLVFENQSSIFIESN